MTDPDAGAVHVLTSAELALLVLLAGERSAVVDLLAIPPLTGLDDPLAAAGLQSLVARDLAGFEGEDLTLEPDVAAIGIAIASATSSFVIGSRAETDAFAARLVESDFASLWLTPRPPGLTRATVLRADTPRADVLAGAALELLAHGSTSVVTIGVEYPRDGDGDDDHGVELRSDGGATRYRLVLPNVPEEQGSLATDELRDVLSRL